MSEYSARIIPYDLIFNIPGRTSRGTMKSRKVWFINISDGTNFGIGECAPLPGLSIDAVENIDAKLNEICSEIETGQVTFDLSEWPSIQFALETAFIDLKNGGMRDLFPSSFTKGDKAIPINGLIWMGSKDFMLEQVKHKIESGFSCLKLKIGGLDFQDELNILDEIRSEYDSNILEIRLDANGGFSPTEASEKLSQLSEYEIHSIEQPILPGQYELSAKIISNSPIPIAFDEELIGLKTFEEKKRMIESTGPDFIIIKPSLIGGFSGAKEWIDLAESNNIGWWITSALESNIGLNAIAQWTATFNTDMLQGLGTGQVFSNNFDCPLELGAGILSYDLSKHWDLGKII